MGNVVIEIPENMLLDAKIPKNKAGDILKRELAVHLYARKILSLGNARRLAGMSKIDFHFLIGGRGIERGYDIDAYEKDRETIKKWLKN